MGWSARSEQCAPRPPASLLQWRSKKVILATGVRDLIPDIKGFATCEQVACLLVLRLLPASLNQRPSPGRLADFCFVRSNAEEIAADSCCPGRQRSRVNLCADILGIGHPANPTRPPSPSAARIPCRTCSLGPRHLGVPVCESMAGSRPACCSLRACLPAERGCPSMYCSVVLPYARAALRKSHFRHSPPRKCALPACLPAC